MVRVFGVWLLALALVRAQEPAASAPDFSEGFRLLRELGLPDVSGAAWGRFEAEGGRRGGGVWAPIEGAARSLEVSLKGNGWRLPEDEGGDGLVLGGAVEPTEAQIERKKGLLGRLLGGGGRSSNDGGGGVQGSWEDCDLAADLETLRKALEAREGEDPDEMMMMVSGFGDASWGVLLVFAAQVHAAGREAEANALAEAIFEKAGRTSGVIDSAVASLAERDFGAVTTAFFDNHDWKAYRDGLQELLEKYPRGWSKAGAVRILLPKAEARAKGEPVPVPSIEGETIRPEALAQIERLGTGGPPLKKGGLAALAEKSGFDLSELSPEMRQMIIEQLSASGQLDGVAVQSAVGDLWPLKGIPDLAEGAAPLDTLRAMKMDGVLALAALLTDETLVPVTQGRSQNYYSSSRWLSGGMVSEVAQAEQQYKSMKRPATRGELARGALEPALPDRNGELGGYLPEELQEYAIDWWRRNRNAEPLELARLYLIEGHSGQQREAAEWLAGQDNEGAARVFEAGIFEAPSLLEMVPTVETYVRVRKEKAKPFFDKFAAEVKAEADSGGGGRNPFGGSLSYHIEEAGGIDGYLKKLEVHVAPVSPEEVLRDIESGALGAEQGIEILGELFSEKQDEYPAFLVNAAAQVNEIEVRSVLLSKVFEMTYRGGLPGEGDPAEKGARLLASTREAWKELLNDGREMPESWYAGMRTVQQFAAMTMEPLGGGEFDRLWTLIEAMGDGCTELVMERAEARIEGRELPPLPDAARVDDARRQEMRVEAAKAEARELVAMMEEWSWDERLAWGEIMDEWEGGLPDGLAELQWTVTDVAEKPPNGGTAWEVGTKVDLERLKTMVKDLRANIDANAGMIWYLTETVGRRGLKLGDGSQYRQWYGMNAVRMMESAGMKKGVVVTLQSEEAEGYGVWPADDTEEMGEDMVANQNALWEAIGKIIERGRWGEETSLVVVVLDEESTEELMESEAAE